MSNDESLIITDVALNPEEFIEDLFTLIKPIRPNWSKLCIMIKRFVNGITNETYGLFQVDSSSKNEIINETEGLILKIYGKNTESLIDRKNEIDIMRYLAKYAMSNTLLLQFNNGFISSYFPGRNCTCHELSSSHIAKLIAIKMAKYHSIPIEKKGIEANLFGQIQNIVRLLNSNIGIFPEILLDIEYIGKFVIPKFKLDIVLCHNDLLSANIIYNENENDVFFIDFEYSSYNYWLYDIANHFGEYIDYFEQPDVDLYPSREFRKEWLSIYLSNRMPKMENLCFDLDQLCDLTEKLTALSHLFWSLWLFVQIDSMNSQNFEYEKYANIRYQRYLQFKKYLYN